MIIFNRYVNNYCMPLIVAEMSCNHKGQIQELFKAMSMAMSCGADVVKIQCYGPDNLTLNNGYTLEKGAWKGQNLYELYKRSQTPLEWMPEVFKYAKDNSIPLFSSVYDDQGLSALEAVDCPVYKIASFEANNPYLLKKVVSTGKPVIISTGTMDLDELKVNIGVIHPDYLNNICLLHCVSKYPTKLDECNLCNITDLQHQFPNIPIGFSDHTEGPFAASVATALGACLIEKHFSGTYENEIDHFSAGPVYFMNLVQACRSTYNTVNYSGSELEEETELKRSIFVTQKLSKGSTITTKDVGIYRPYLGEKPGRLQDIIGKQVNRDLDAGTPFRMEYIDND